MNVDLFSLMVKERILDNDEVVLPGIGVFVAEVVPSSFSDKGYTVNPPYRRLSFRHKPDAAGDDLAQIYARDNSIDIKDASRILTDFLAEMQEILKKKKAVELPGLGRLRATKENNFFFVPDEDLDIWPDGFGLHPVSLKFHQETKEEVSEAIGALADIIQTPAAPLTSKEEAPEAKPIKEEVAEPAKEEVPEAEPVKEEVAEPAHPEEVLKAETIKEEAPEAEPVKEESKDPVVQTETSDEDDFEFLDEDYEEENKKTARKKILRAVLFSVAGIAACLVLYVAIARLNPGIFDSILYTGEELKIIRQASILP